MRISNKGRIKMRITNTEKNNDVNKMMMENFWGNRKISSYRLHQNNTDNAIKEAVEKHFIAYCKDTDEYILLMEGQNIFNN